MQSSHRTEDNPALRFAVEQADKVHLPLVVYFGLWQSYPEANLRHFRFMLEGLAEVAHSLSPWESGSCSALSHRIMESVISQRTRQS